MLSAEILYLSMFDCSLDFLWLCLVRIKFLSMRYNSSYFRPNRNKRPVLSKKYLNTGIMDIHTSKGLIILNKYLPYLTKLCKIVLKMIFFSSNRITNLSA